MKTFKTLLLSVCVLGMLAAHAESPKVQAKLAASQAAPANTLLFFLNPNGQPCQTQSQIIDEIRPQIEKQVKIVPVSTTVFADQSQFRKYGIRYLPALILVDGNQQEIKRFSPGIQPREEILKEISALKSKS